MCNEGAGMDTQKFDEESRKILLAVVLGLAAPVAFLLWVAIVSAQ
jgi:hypothetical protein